MKKFILSVDYELFFGSDSGTVENCMIRPMRRLTKELGHYNYKMTIFWDILHFYRLLQLEKEVIDLFYDRSMIQQQILTMIRQGHDIQMLINPHWLDARWENNKWQFSHQRFSIHRLWNQPDANNIETILGCVTQCRLLMESVCQQEDPTYKVRVFRAGGGRIEPFSMLAEAFRSNGIKVDSSFIYGIKSKNPFPFDYTEGPRNLYYRFNDSILSVEEDGFFWEFPKGSVRVPWILRAIFYIQSLFSKVSLSRYGNGKPLKFTHRESWGHSWFYFGAKYYRLSLEYYTSFRWTYLMGKAREHSQIVVNSKNIGPYTIRLVRSILHKKQARFFSFEERLKELNVYDNW